MTMLYSVCSYHSSDEVNVYILDYGSEVLRVFKQMPQVGDVALVDDEDKLKGLLLMLEREQTRRKELFSDYGGNYNSYIKTSGVTLPLIMVFLNGYDSFLENYGSYEDVLVHLIRESSKYGIVFIVSAVSTSAVRTNIRQLFNSIMLLQLNDPFDYKYILNTNDNITPSRYFGRGISVVSENAYEFQTAYIYLKDKINDVIRESADKLSKIYKKVSKIPVIPSNVNSDSLTSYIDSFDNVPIGINMNDGTVCKYNFMNNRINQVTGGYIIRDNKFIEELVKVLTTVSGIKLKVFDFVDYFGELDGVDCAKGEFTNNIMEIISNARIENKTFVYVFVGIGHIYDKVLDEGIDALFNVFSNINNYSNSYFIIADNYSSYKKTMKENWYLNNVNKSSGIWIGADVDTQIAIRFNNMSKADANDDFNGVCYVNFGDSYSVIKALGTSKEGGSY